MFPLLLALGLLLIGTTLLVIGADWFLDGAGDLARALGVSALVLGVLLAGLEPEEMLTAAIASVRGAPTLAVGNVIGTNITIITAALGLSALIFPMVIDRSVRRQALLATLVSILPVVLLFCGVVTQAEGVLLLAVFVSYTFFLFRTDQEAVKRLAAFEGDDEDDEDQEQHARPRLHGKPILLTVGGLAAMALGGPAIVEGALQLTRSIGLSQGAVGATIVSLGTGAEMLALGVSAARKQRSDLLVGGILGSFAGSGSLEQDSPLSIVTVKKEEQACLMHHRRLGKRQRHADKASQALTERIIPTLYMGGLSRLFSHGGVLLLRDHCRVCRPE